MTYRKTWFDYVLWAVYAGLCVMFLAVSGYHIYASYVGLPLARLGAFLVFPLLVCAYLALRLSCQVIHKKFGFSIHGAAMLEALAVSVSFVFGLILRISKVLYTVPEVVPGTFYERALVRPEQTAEPLLHGVSDLYVRSLSVVFSFLGNGPASAMFFQVVLQILAMVLGFCAVRMAAGRLAACTSLLFVAFSDMFLTKITVIDPECLFLVLYLLGLFFAVSLVKAVLCGKPGNVCLPASICLGIVLGILIYLELWSVTLLFFLIGLITGKCQEQVDRKLCIIVFCVTVIACVAGFFISAVVDCAVSGTNFSECLSGWVSLYGKTDLRGIFFGAFDGQYIFMAFLFLAAAFLIFEFIRGGKEPDYTLWFLPCIFAAPLLFSDFDRMGFKSIALFLWSAMAGLGVKNCVSGGQAEAVFQKIKEINEAAKAVVTPKEEKTRFIENPLPLPKKHVRREMNYDYEVPEADMHFQIEIAEEDDFDH